MKKILNNWNTKRFTFDMTEEQYDVLLDLIKKYIEGVEHDIWMILNPQYLPSWAKEAKQKEMDKQNRRLLNLKQLYENIKFYVKKEKLKGH